MAPPLVKLISMYFPKRLELSFRMVLAFPKAERQIQHRVNMFEVAALINRNGPRRRGARTLQDGIRLQDLLFNPGALSAHRRQELQHQLGALGFSCPRLATG